MSALVQVYALLAHLIGDYVFQTNEMARLKRQSLKLALAHAITYSVPFLFIPMTVYETLRIPHRVSDNTLSFNAWLLIAGSHLLIDHFGLARYVVWLRNNLFAFSNAHTPYMWHRAGIYGEPPEDHDKPYIAFWILVLCDNTMHLTLNALALALWGPR